MANEPERPIETLLRAAAKKRRDEAGAPFALHPADRRVLQQEVARTFAPGKPETRGFAQRLGLWWPQLAAGLGILAVLGLSVWLVLPPPERAKPEALMARNQPAPEARPAKEPSWLYVYRHYNNVQRHALTQPAYRLLEQLFSKQPVAAALEAAAADPANADAIATHLQAWFAEWTAKGFFRQDR